MVQKIRLTSWGEGSLSTIIYKVLAPSKRWVFSPDFWTINVVWTFHISLWPHIEALAEDALVWRDGDPPATEISLSSDGHLTVVRHGHVGEPLVNHGGGQWFVLVQVACRNVSKTFRSVANMPNSFQNSTKYCENQQQKTRKRGGGVDLWQICDYMLGSSKLHRKWSPGYHCFTAEDSSRYLMILFFEASQKICKMVASGFCQPKL